MRKTLRRELWFLRTYVTVSAVLLALLSTAAFRRLTVDAAGNPRIEFLDETGKVVARIPQ